MNKFVRSIRQRPDMRDRLRRDAWGETVSNSEGRGGIASSFMVLSVFFIL
jgi:hypothetical protein